MQIVFVKFFIALFSLTVPAYLFLSFFQTPTSHMTDRTIIIIRHAEKHEWINNLPPTKEQLKNFKDNHKLSARGYERALKLVSYFQKNKDMVDILKKHPMTAIIAQDIDTETKFGLSKRPKETVLPLGISF